jgi:4-amino-4-deoxy-L-arabinose transferase-like glycosyltransferase
VSIDPAVSPRRWWGVAAAVLAAAVVLALGLAAWLDDPPDANIGLGLFLLFGLPLVVLLLLWALLRTRRIRRAERLS